MLLCEFACPGLGIKIERVEEAFVHAPPTTGIRFSGGEDNDVNGGKSVDCKTAGMICCGGDGWRLSCDWPPFRPGELRELPMELS